MIPQGDMIKNLHGIAPPEIRFGDCLEVMKDLRDDSVDLIMTSPPYGDARKHTYGGIPPSKYVEWFGERAAQMKRVLKPSGSCIINIKEGSSDGERLTYVLKLVLAMKEEWGWRWVDEYIWHKTSVMPGKWRYRFKDAWERCLHFAKAPDIKMNQDSVKLPVKETTVRRFRNVDPEDDSVDVSATGSGFKRKSSNMKRLESVYPSNVLTLAALCHNVGHSAAFPESLPEFFIKLFTDEGDTVLDPFVGSGTTARVAYRLSRNAIGIEMNPDTEIDLWDGRKK